MCVICERLKMRVVSIAFAFDDIPGVERIKITKAIKAAYEGTGRQVFVIDEYNNTRRRCPAYPRDADGGQAIVHTGHCTGAFEGIPKCPYYDASRTSANEQCRYRKEVI